MNISSIKKGDRIPNYKALCRLLKEDEKSGASKRSQLKIWEQFFSYERDKNAYVITEVYEEPHNKDDGRMTFMKYSVPLILHYISKSEDDIIDLTIKRWLAQTSMIPEIVLDDEINNEYEIKSGFNHLEVQYLVNAISNVSQRAFLTALSNLQNDNIIRYEKRLCVSYPDGQVVDASKEDERYIDDVQERIFEELGVNRMFSILMSKNRMKLYYERMSEIYEEEKGWDSSFYKVKIEKVDFDFINQYENINVLENIKGLFKEIYNTVNKKITKAQNEADFTDFEITKFQLASMQANDMRFILEEILL